MIWLLIPVIFSLVLISLIARIVITRRRFLRFYCPKYTNFFLAHLNEIVKAKQPLNVTLLQWSNDSGNDAFVLFSSWRVHIHVIDTFKIKKILGSTSIYKAHNSGIANFCGVDVLGNKSLLTDPGTASWVSVFNHAHISLTNTGHCINMFQTIHKRSLINQV